MGDKTGIEWTDATWNPTTGCDRVSPGCDNCYALELAGRLKLMGSSAYQNDGDPRTSGPGFGLTMHPNRLDQPLRWKRPRRIFVNSMSDLFHPAVPVEFIVEVFVVMAKAKQHQFQILTKRPQRMAQVVSDMWFDPRVGLLPRLDPEVDYRPLPNVWMGTSIETDRYAFRANHLRKTLAEVRFLSLEPLLGPLPSLDVHGVDWVIVGGESGPNHRPIETDWVREIRDRCVDAGVAFFFKQWGGRTPKANGRELDGRTWDQFPVGLWSVTR